MRSVADGVHRTLTEMDCLEPPVSYEGAATSALKGDDHVPL
jgi:hypothetical protein